MADTFYPSEQAAVTALLPGYTVVGRTPHMVTVANPARTPSHPEEPATISKQSGWELSVQGPNKEPDTITVSDLGPNPSNTGGPKGGVGITVLEGPKKEPTKTATAPGSWTPLDANGKEIPSGSSTKPVFLADPKAAPGTPPFRIETSSAQQLGDPSTWTPIRRDQNDPTSPVVGLFDPKSQSVAASLGAEPSAKPTGVFTPVKVDGKTVGMTDDGDKSFHPVTAQDGHQVITTPTGIYSYDQATDTTKLLQAITPNTPLQGVTFPDGSIYTLDTQAGKLTKLQGAQLPNTITSPTPAGNVTLVLDPDTNSYKPAPGAPAPVTVDNSTTLKRIVYRNASTGEVISDNENVNYAPPAATVPAPNTTAPMIQVQDPKDPSKLVWIKNEGQVTASEALKNLATHLSGQVVSGDITVDEAKAIIDASNARMTADTNKMNAVTSAASNVLTNTASNAQTGAGLLQNRVTAATGALNSLIGSAAGSKMTSIGPGVGQGLVQGLTDWTTQLGGGDATYQTAARLVQAADPKISGDPTLAQQAQQALAGMFSQWQQETGQPHPAVAATVAAQQSQQTGGMTAPDTTSGLQQGQQTNATPNPFAGQVGQNSTAALNARGLMDNQQGRAIAAGQTPVAAGGAPQYPGQYNTAWLQGIRSPVGMISTGPNAANGFIAPLIPV